MRQLTRILPLLCLAFVASGCRLPKLYFVQNTQPPVAYDTAWERGSDDVRLASTGGHDELVQRYGDTLAEPVALIDWQPDVSSTWQILYATNRGRLKGDGADRVTYGNAVETNVAYGHCMVTLPHRARGTDAPTAQTIAKQAESFPHRLAKQFGRDDEPPESLAELKSVQPLADDAFFAQLNDLVARSRQQDVLVFVHGFNVSYEQAVLRATQVAADIPFNGAIVVYSWPSQGGLGNYKRDGEIVEESRGPFLDFLRELGERLPADADINIVVHSMGNRLLTRTLWHLPDSFTNPPRFREIVLCAPDVARDQFVRDARRIVDVSQRATLYKNGNDSALIVSRYRNIADRAGESFNPVLIDGLDTIETATVDTSLMGHSYYGSNTSILRDLFAIIKEHRPAADRPWLQQKKMPFNNTPWWIIADFPQELDWTWHFDDARTPTHSAPTAQVVPPSGQFTKRQVNAHSATNH